MDEFIKAFKDIIENSKYGTLIKYIFFALSLICPSYIFIFLFRRNFFIKIDFMKLLLVTVSTNLLMFIMIYLFIFANMSVVLKSRKLKENIEAQIFFNENNENNENTAFIVTECIMFAIGILLIFEYLIGIYNINARELRYFTLCIIGIMFIITIFNNFKFYYYKNKSKNRYQKMLGKNS